MSSSPVGTSWTGRTVESLGDCEEELPLVYAPGVTISTMEDEGGDNADVSMPRPQPVRGVYNVRPVYKESEHPLWLNPPTLDSPVRDSGLRSRFTTRATPTVEAALEELAQARPLIFCHRTGGRDRLDVTNEAPSAAPQAPFGMARDQRFGAPRSHNVSGAVVETCAAAGAYSSDSRDSAGGTVPWLSGLPEAHEVHHTSPSTSLTSTISSSTLKLLSFMKLPMHLDDQVQRSASQSEGAARDSSLHPSETVKEVRDLPRRIHSPTPTVDVWYSASALSESNPIPLRSSTGSLDYSPHGSFFDTESRATSVTTSQSRYRGTRSTFLEPIAPADAVASDSLALRLARLFHMEATARLEVSFRQCAGVLQLIGAAFGSPPPHPSGPAIRDGHRDPSGKLVRDRWATAIIQQYSRELEIREQYVRTAIIEAEEREASTKLFREYAIGNVLLGRIGGALRRFLRLCVRRWRQRKEVLRLRLARVAKAEQELRWELEDSERKRRFAVCLGFIHVLEADFRFSLEKLVLTAHACCGALLIHWSEDTARSLLPFRRPRALRRSSGLPRCTEEGGTVIIGAANRSINGLPIGKEEVTLP